MTRKFSNDLAVIKLAYLLWGNGSSLGRSCFFYSATARERERY